MIRYQVAQLFGTFFIICFVCFVRYIPFFRVCRVVLF